MNRIALLQMLERRIPEFQVQNFAFARQQIVFNSQPLHRPQVAANNGGSDDVGHFRGLAAILLRWISAFRRARRGAFCLRRKIA